MSSAEPIVNEKLLQYVEQALRTNPLEQSAAIIRRRSRLLGLETPAVPQPAAKAAVDPGVQRQTLMKRIESIRAGFWTMPLGALRESIAKLDAADFPDVEAVVRRLTVVAKHRDQIPRILGNKAFDADFFRVFKDVLIDAPRDSAIAKEQVLVAFGERKLRRRGTKMIKLIERELPYLYELESQWLKSLVAQRGSAKASTASRDHFVEAGSSGFSIPWWGYGIIFAVIKLVLRAASGE